MTVARERPTIRPARPPIPAPAGRTEQPGAATGAVSTAELAECTCPDFCERDHANE
jgi:hypothetical protein